MKIVGYKKKKNNIYEIKFQNNNSIELYDDIILKYELLLKKEVSEVDLIKIEEDNNYTKSYYEALKYISVKLRTEKEIRKKIKDYDKKVVDKVIKRLKEEGYINNKLYIKSYVNDEINLNCVGPNKILFDLVKLDFDENEIKSYLDNFDDDTWLSKIDKYINKKISGNRNMSGLLLKQKIIKELLNKGFYKEDINKIIDNYSFIDDSAIYEKEYNKLKSKLSKKYSDEELEYQIKSRLYKKGFNIK